MTSIYTYLNPFKDDPDRLSLIILYFVLVFIGAITQKDLIKRILIIVVFTMPFLVSFLFPNTYSEYSETSQTSLENFLKEITTESNNYLTLIFLFLIAFTLMFVVPFLLFSHSKIYLYSQKGDLEGLKKELEKGSDPTKVHRLYRTSALQIASEVGHVNIVSFLLSKGALPNTQDTVGYSPLHAACGSGSLEIVCMLIAAGADVNIRAWNNGVTPLHLAVRNYPEILKVLIDAKADLNPKASSGMTPLHYAVLEKSYDSAVLLVNNGADVNIAMPDGLTPLEKAIQNQDTKMIEILKSHNAL
ncbi:ankyrin repeat domain-containing protein [Tumidithrix elongata RA019]|uniref:Ankyrin repeat domain-containing protein n=1 Tax=Tumidithrix elongata BACA0141 TaxID=2716417 RepID=A0AAW9PX05_9CYAN|nr:ankyrin repeat domain-containing protein [Tumidithrix elongata RA019]